MPKIAGKKTIRDQTVKDMKALGTYKPEYSRIIEIYAQIMAEYNQITKDFEENGYKIEVNTDQGGSKKSPTLSALEVLRKDILAYSDRLCLNPKALETVTIEKSKSSKLAAALEKMK